MGMAGYPELSNWVDGGRLLEDESVFEREVEGVKWENG